MSISTYIIVGLAVVLVTAILLMKFVSLKTGWLILRTEPFEQRIVGTPKVLILGDSTGYGTGADEPEESVAGRLGADYNVTVINNSVNGWTLQDLVQEIDNVLGSFELIVLQIGANDILQKRNIMQVEEELRQLISILLPKTNHLVMMSSGNVGASSRFSGNEAEEYEALTREYREMFRAVANETQLTYVDLFNEPANDEFLKKPNTYLAIDGLHPSSEGYEQWYEKLRVVTDPLLAEHTKPWSIYH